MEISQEVLLKEAFLFVAEKTEKEIKQAGLKLTRKELEEAIAERWFYASQNIHKLAAILEEIAKNHQYKKAA